MICPICKSNIREGSLVCPVCGKQLQPEAPGVHNIETVEPPKTENSPSSFPEQVRGNAQEQPAVRPQVQPPEKDPSFETVQSKPAAETEIRNSRPDMPGNRNFQGNMPQGNRPNMGGGRQDGPVQGPAGRNYQQYQNIPPQGQPPRGPSQPRPAGVNPAQRRPLSEKEYNLLRKNLSTRSLISFICGIFGICSGFLSLPFSIVGLVISIVVRNEYKNRNLQPDTDLKLTNVGFICSIIGIVFGAIALIMILISGAGIIAALSALADMGGGSSYYGY